MDRQTDKQTGKDSDKDKHKDRQTDRMNQRKQYDRHKIKDPASDSKPICMKIRWVLEQYFWVLLI